MEKYSTIEDKGLRQHYKSYSNSREEGRQDFYWSLSTITHRIIYDYEQKYYKWEKEKENEKEKEGKVAP